MANPNPLMLKWAREKAGLSLEEASKKLAFKIKEGDLNMVDKFERGQAVPTTKKLNEIARLYRRSLVIFYLSSPPTEAPKGEDFRTLPDTPSPRDNATLDALVRDVYVRKNIVREALIDADIAVNHDFISSINIDTDTNEAAKKIYDIFEISLSDYRSCSDAHEAFNYLRKKIEERGIYVLLIGNIGSHHSNISIETFRGIAISDNFAPFIVINDNDSKFAWSFTLLHEVVHIFLGKSGVSNIGKDNKVEKFCNDVASKVLLDDADLNSFGISEDIELDQLIHLASQKSPELNISATMIMYRAYSLGFITIDEWVHSASHFRNLWLTNKINQEKKNGNPTYYITKKHKTGAALINTVKRSILEGVMTQTKAGKVLGVKPGIVSELVGL